MNGTVRLYSVTVAANSAVSGGGAICNLGFMANDTGDPAGHSYAASLSVENSILADSASGVSDLVSSAPASLVPNGLSNTAAASATGRR
ncbi:MAG: hypothetical protein WKF62_07170 [Solirubrobacterales bacterium]